MTSASDSCAAGFCVTFDNSVNIERPKGQFSEAANVINSNPAAEGVFWEARRRSLITRCSPEKYRRGDEFNDLAKSEKLELYKLHQAD